MVSEKAKEMNLIKLSNQILINPEKIERIETYIFPNNTYELFLLTSSSNKVFNKKFYAWEGKDITFFMPYIRYLIKVGIENDTFTETLSIIKSQEDLLSWLNNQIYLTVTDIVKHMVDRIPTTIRKTIVKHPHKSEIYIIFHTSDNLTPKDLMELVWQGKAAAYTVDSIKGICDIKIAKEESLDDSIITDSYIEAITSAVRHRVIDKYRY